MNETFIYYFHFSAFDILGRVIHPILSKVFIETPNSMDIAEGVQLCIFFITLVIYGRNLSNNRKSFETRGHVSSRRYTAKYGTAFLKEVLFYAFFLFFLDDEF